MKILYLPCHSILEYDEVKLFTEMGHDVYSMDSYRNPNSPIDPKRPPITGGKYHDYLDRITSQCSKENLHQELIDWADAIYVMHKHEWVILNWEKMKKKKVIWRSIGQSIPDQESLLALPRMEGMKIVRYSPREIDIPGYIGHDAIIRFYKDKDEFACWTGQIPAIITVAQNMKTPRAKFCGYELFMKITQNMPRKIFGPGNEDTSCNGGILSYEELKAVYRNHLLYFYTGTYPASYTLNFIEALMTGIPVVAIGATLANINLWPMQTYEVHEIIKHRVNGFCSDDPDELRSIIDSMFQHPEIAKAIGEAGRQTAIELFGKDTIQKQWEDFFKTL